MAILLDGLSAPRANPKPGPVMLMFSPSAKMALMAVLDTPVTTAARISSKSLCSSKILSSALVCSSGLLGKG